MATYFAVVSVVTFVVWGVDKLRAVQHLWRIPERWLIILTLVGGSFGALAGMLFFRHKTRKFYFWLWVGFGCVLHTLVIYFFIIRR